MKALHWAAIFIVTVPLLLVRVGPVSAYDTSSSIPQTGNRAALEATETAILAGAEARQVIQFNPGAALQKRIFADGFVPNSGEFAISAASANYVAQRAEHLATGRVRVYFAVLGDWGN